MRISLNVLDGCLEERDIDQCLSLFYPKEKYERAFSITSGILLVKTVKFNIFIITIA